MALVTEFEPVKKERQAIHKPVRCGVSHFIGSNDKRYIQLDTYGSQNRDFPDKISQSIQLDEAAAKRLIEMIHECFPNLR